MKTISIMDLANNLTNIRQRIAAACRRAGRAPESVTFQAVSKNQPPEAIRRAADLGLTLFGENRVQEAKVKIGQCPGHLRWHMIGHLQSNKCRDAVQFLFDDSKRGQPGPCRRRSTDSPISPPRRCPYCLKSMSLGNRANSAIRPNRLLAELRQINALKKFEIHGLMTVAPYATDAEKVRPVFRRLRELKAQCEDILGAPLPHLSMGMSGDFEVAIEEGSTIVRIGTAFFRERPKLNKNADLSEGN